ncbi:phage head closure protein [Methylobacterium oryzisoli]|uniref:phage head closure protein n=1 Tax=Methylobacterium oryzisoli TaxID=3385502 RepID=UPI00397E8A2F
MKIDAKRFDRTIRIERVIEHLNARGTPTGTDWSLVATLRAQLVQGSTSELLRTVGQVAEAGLTFRTRYHDGITTSDRLVYDGQELELVEVRELGRRQGLELRTKTQVAS